MPGTTNQVFVAVSGPSALFRIRGRATALESTGFKTAIEALLGRGCTQFAIDLVDCQSMDSTFIGVLTGLSRRLRAGGTAGSISLVGLGALVRQQLDNLFVLDQFDLIECAPGPETSYEPLPGTAPGKAELCRLMLEAHRSLMDANAANVARFKPVTDFLEQDLRRLPPGP